jgi:hypothetical protein
VFAHVGDERESSNEPQVVDQSMRGHGSEGDISQKPLAMNVAINVNAASARANPSTDVNSNAMTRTTVGAGAKTRCVASRLTHQSLFF